jgi:uncharacterized protein (DUF1015 family)
MAEIQPFAGLSYNTARVKLDAVITQPYDKITPPMRETYLARDPNNFVRVELGKEEPDDNETNNKYTRARDLFKKWQREGILKKATKPAIYALRQTFKINGQTKTRNALIAAVRLSPFGDGKILPHEHTLSKPKADRLALLRETRIYTGQIFMLYPQISDEISQIFASPPKKSMLAHDDYDVENQLWAVTDEKIIAAVQETLRDQPFYIADGHHRYETAIAYRDERRAAAATQNPDAPYEFVMTTLVHMEDPGLVILPTHRTVSNLGEFRYAKFSTRLAEDFTIEPKRSWDVLQAAMKPERADDFRIGMFSNQGGFALVQPKNLKSLLPQFASKPPLWHTLDVAILHVSILEKFLGIDEERLREEANVRYYRDAAEAAAEVQARRAQLAFFLNPTTVAQVKTIADARSRMPQKSTDFYPKLPSGLVMYDVS